MRRSQLIVALHLAPVRYQFDVDPVRNVAEYCHFRYRRIYLRVHLTQYVRATDGGESGAEVVDVRSGVVTSPTRDGAQSDVGKTASLFAPRHVAHVLVDRLDAAFRVERKCSIEGGPVAIDVERHLAARFVKHVYVPTTKTLKRTRTCDFMILQLRLLVDSLKTVVLKLLSESVILILLSKYMRAAKHLRKSIKII